MLSKHSVGTCKGTRLTCNLSGKAHVKLSVLTELLWTDPCVKSGVGAHKLIFTLKKRNKKKKEEIYRQELDLLSPKLLMWRKGHMSYMEFNCCLYNGSENTGLTDTNLFSSFVFNLYHFRLYATTTNSPPLSPNVICITIHLCSMLASCIVCMLSNKLLLMRRSHTETYNHDT